MVTKLFPCILAGALLMPAAAFGKDGTVAPRLSALPLPLPLPPIPYLETIPWLSTEANGPRQKVDQLLGPDLDTLKLALHRGSPLTTRYSSMPRRAGPAGRPEK